MPFIDIATKKEDEVTRLVYCLLVVSQGMAGQYETLHFYNNERGRNMVLRRFQKDCILSLDVFFTFQIPVDFYLDKAQKHI